MELAGKVLFYGLFYIVLAGIILSYCGRRKGDTELLGREAARELKGVAILMVLLGHLTFIYGFIEVPLTPALGAPAVDIFLFLSAYGLMHSYESKGLKGFVGRRLAVILIPYTVTTLIKLLVFMPIGSWTWRFVLANLLPIAANITGMLDTSMWYVQYILLCYALFFIIFAIPGLAAKWKVALLSVIGLGTAVIFGFFYYRGTLPYMISLGESYSHHLSFPLGAVFYLVYEKAKKLSYKAYIPIAAVAFVIVQFIVFPGCDGFVKYYANNIFYIVFFVALMGILKHFGLRSGLLQWMGDMAYYIYLNELLVMGWFYGQQAIPDGIRALLIMAVSIAAAVPVRYLCDWILRKLKVR